MGGRSLMKLIKVPRPSFASSPSFRRTSPTTAGATEIPAVSGGRNEAPQHSTSFCGLNAVGSFSGSRLPSIRLLGATNVHQSSRWSSGLAGISWIHMHPPAAAPADSSYGVGPAEGADRDPKSKGSTPDDFRADFIHMVEPKEVTKEKAAIAQQEPPDFQVKKTMPQWEKPVELNADSQTKAEDQVFEGNTRTVEGTAQKQGDTTGNESGERVEGQYGATPDEGTTSRA